MLSSIDINLFSKQIPTIFNKTVFNLLLDVGITLYLGVLRIYLFGHMKICSVLSFFSVLKIIFSLTHTFSNHLS